MNDGYRALVAVAFDRACVLLLALLLQLPIMQHRQIRYVLGSLIASALLLLQPGIYSTPTQPYGLVLATFACVASWSVLHWTFLEPVAHKPTVTQVFFSTITHPLHGVLKVHRRVNRKQQQQQAAAAQVSGSTPNIWALLWETAVTLLIVHITCDVGLFLLCHLSNGMCSSSSSGSSWSFKGTELLLLPARSSIPQLSAKVPYAVRCAFAFPAGILLTQQIEIMYGAIRLGMLLGAFKWRGLLDLAAQMPTRAFRWPVAATSVGELWGERWHQTLRFYFESLGGAAVGLLLGPPNSAAGKGKASKHVNAAARCVAAFVLSGLAHEYLTWAVFGSVTGWHMAFFMLNCAAVLFENTAGPVLLAVLHKQWVRHTRSRSQPTARVCSTPAAALTPTGQTVGACAVTAHVTLGGSCSTALDGDKHMAADTGSAQASKDSDGSNGSISSGGSGSSGSDGSGSRGSGSRSPGLFVVPVWLKHVWTLSFFVLLGPLFVEPCRLSGFFAERAFHPPWGTPVTPRAVSWVLDALLVPGTA